MTKRFECAAFDSRLTCHRPNALSSRPAPSGTPIYAIADGVLHRGPYNFHVFKPDEVQAVETVHGDLLVRYTEIKPGTFPAGTKVIKKGQKIAEVGLMISPKGIRYEMLHIEIYTNPKSTAPLTDTGRHPTYRRADLTDPTPYLDKWVNNLPQPE